MHFEFHRLQIPLGQIVIEFLFLSSRPDAEMSSFFKHSFFKIFIGVLFNGCQRLLNVVRGNFMLFEALKYLVSAPAIDFKFTTYIGLGKSQLVDEVFGYQF